MPIEPPSDDPDKRGLWLNRGHMAVVLDMSPSNFDAVIKPRLGADYIHRKGRTTLFHTPTCVAICQDIYPPDSGHRRRGRCPRCERSD
jgi:hypothetical protein